MPNKEEDASALQWAIDYANSLVKKPETPTDTVLQSVLDYVSSLTNDRKTQPTGYGLLPLELGRSMVVTSGEFADHSARITFLDGKDVKSVIAADQVELDEMKGSFDAIARRMQFLLLSAKAGEFIVPDAIKCIKKIDGYMGHQSCPFSGCPHTWNDEVVIENIKTGRRLTINQGTVHLVEDHSLLEKGQDNPYGVTAAEFYEHFM